MGAGRGEFVWGGGVTKKPHRERKGQQVKRHNAARVTMLGSWGLNSQLDLPPYGNHASLKSLVDEA